MPVVMPVAMPVVMPVAMPVVMPVVVVGACLWRRDEAAVQVSGTQRFDRGPGLARANRDALLREQIERASADAARDHDSHALVAQPAGEKPRRMGRRGDGARADDLPLLLVGLQERELAAPAEVAVKPSVGCW